MEEQTTKRQTKTNIRVIKTYYDLELERIVKVDEILKVSSTRANLLIEKKFAIKK